VGENISLDICEEGKNQIKYIPSALGSGQKKIDTQKGSQMNENPYVQLTYANLRIKACPEGVQLNIASPLKQIPLAAPISQACPHPFLAYMDVDA
jgi:hypothetical protein